MFDKEIQLAIASRNIPQDAIILWDWGHLQRNPPGQDDGMWLDQQVLEHK